MPTPFKDLFFSKQFVEQLAAALAQRQPQFDAATFVDRCLQAPWPELELMARMQRLSEHMHLFLSGDYPERIQLLESIAPELQGEGRLVLPDYVARYGLDHWEVSMRALGTFTQYGTSEFGVRPFLLHNPQRTLQHMLQWAHSPNHHLRRLSSEGARPRLPWAAKIDSLIANPEPLLPILSQLRNDPSEYVRRSVANNLNDISKDHPDWVLALAAQWKGQSPLTDRLLKHALRGLLKKANPTALRLFDLHPEHALEQVFFDASNPQPMIGQKTSLRAKFVVPGTEALTLRFEYRVHFVKKRGQVSAKIFQWTERSFAPGEHMLQHSHSFEDRSIRLHYSGPHRVELIVNGQPVGQLVLQLLPPRL